MDLLLRSFAHSLLTEPAMPKPPEISIEFCFEPWFSYKSEGDLLSTIEPQARRWGQLAYYRALAPVRSAKEKRVPANIILLKHHATNLEVDAERLGIMLALIVSWSGGETTVEQMVEITRLSELATRYQKFKQTLEKKYQTDGAPLVLIEE